MTDATTDSEDYGDAYFSGYSGGDYHSDAEHWHQFFGDVAAKLIGLFEPSSLLDVGCAKGLLVAAFADRDVDAHGIDISAFAIGEADEKIRDRLTVASLAEPISSRYDLVTCIEVLEHMSPDDAEAALTNVTAATDRIVFSSTPEHFEDPTHINVRQPADWAARFAERGFFRRTDLDLTFLSPWAMAFEKRTMSARDIVFAYESLDWPRRNEINTKRQALLDKERQYVSEAAKADGFDELAAEAERRQVAIDELAAEAERRQVAIDELAAEAERRQVVIDEVAAEAERRQVVIDEVAAEAERRLQVIDEVAAEAEYRQTVIDTLAGLVDQQQLTIQELQGALESAGQWKTWLRGPQRSDK